MGNKRIEEIVKIICQYRTDDGKCTCNQHQFGVRKCADPCVHREIAMQLAEAGYAPVVHGEWVFGEFGVLGCSVQCSVCGWGSEYANKKAWLEFPGHKHCGSCGAKMDGGKHER